MECRSGSRQHSLGMFHRKVERTTEGKESGEVKLTLPRMWRAEENEIVKNVTHTGNSEFVDTNPLKCTRQRFEDLTRDAASHRETHAEAEAVTRDGT